VPTHWVLDVKFHSLHVGKSYANSIMKTKPNPNCNPTKNLLALTVTVKR